MRIKLLLLIITLVFITACLPAQTIHQAKIVQEGYQDDSLGTGILLELDLPEMPMQDGPLHLQAWTEKVATPEYSSNSGSNSSFHPPSFPKPQHRKGLGGLFTAFATFVAMPAVIIGGVAQNLSNNSNTTEYGYRYPHVVLQRWMIYPMTPGAEYIPELKTLWINSMPQDRKIRILVPYLYMPDGDSLHFGIRADIIGHFHREWVSPKLERKEFDQSISTPVISVEKAMDDDVEGYLLQFSYKLPAFVNVVSLEPWVELDGNRRLPLILPNPSKLAAKDTVLRVFVPIALTNADSRAQFHAKLPEKATFHGERLSLPKGEQPKEFHIELQSLRMTPKLYPQAQRVELQLYADVAGLALKDKMTMANKEGSGKKFEPNASQSSIGVPMMPKDALHLHLEHKGRPRRHLVCKIPASLLNQEEIQLKAGMLFSAGPAPDKFQMKLIVRNGDSQPHPLTIKWNSKARPNRE